MKLFVYMKYVLALHASLDLAEYNGQTVPDIVACKLNRHLVVNLEQVVV